VEIDWAKVGELGGVALFTCGLTYYLQRKLLSAQYKWQRKLISDEIAIKARERERLHKAQVAEVAAAFTKPKLGLASSTERCAGRDHLTVKLENASKWEVRVTRVCLGTDDSPYQYALHFGGADGFLSTGSPAHESDSVVTVPAHSSGEWYGFPRVSDEGNGLWQFDNLVIHVEFANMNGSMEQLQIVADPPVGDEANEIIASAYRLYAAKQEADRRRRMGIE